MTTTLVTIPSASKYLAFIFGADDGTVTIRTGGNDITISLSDWQFLTGVWGNGWL